MQAIKAAMTRENIDKATLMTIIVAALGYFVDIFDLLLFSIVRVQSLQDLGLEGQAITDTGIFLLNVQMAGLLLGGLIWGVLGDRMGRKSVLFGSILMYSLANLANGFVQDVNQYAILRFVGGIGLAGELGAGVTLASELLPKAWRGLGTSFISMVGIMGAALAVVVSEVFDWRTAYIVGGVLGLLLLVMRVNVRESQMYKQLMEKSKDVARGNLFMLLRWRCLKKLLGVVLVGVPLWAVIALFIALTPEFAKDMGMSEIPTAGRAVLFSYVGISVGGMVCGLLSQRLRSRKKAVAVFLSMLTALMVVHICLPYGGSTTLYYTVCAAIGISCGYWAMFVQMGAEQFGTNIRATAATSVPNLVRASVIPVNLGFIALKPALGITWAGMTVVLVTLVIAFAALATLKETFDEDLDYFEE